MKIGELISLVRTTIKQQSDDSKYTDLYIYGLIKSIRAFLIHRDINSNKNISIFNWQTICIKLEKTQFINCDCVPVGCEVLMSTVEIPSVITANKRDLLKVHTFNNIIIPYVGIDRQISNKYSDFMRLHPGYYIQDNKLIIWNDLNLRAIQVSGVFDDPAELSSYKICNQDGAEFDACSFDPNTQDFPLEERLIPALLDAVIQYLLGSIQVPDDKINNAQEPV